MNRTISGFFWISLYLLVVLAPAFAMLVPPAPAGRGFWLELSIALGFVGLTQLAVQFVLIARFKRITAPYGIDIILQYHRQIALLAVVLVLIHPLIIVIDNPARLELLNPFGGNWASRAGWACVLCLVAIVITSLFRERLRINYERWRLMHLLLGVGAIVFAQIHVSLAGLYINTMWKQALWIVTAAAMVGLAVYLRVIKPALQRGYTWRIAQIRAERGDTSTLVLEPVDHAGLRFEPGQFAWIKLAGSPFTLEEHPFSFSSSADQHGRIEFGIKKLGDFTRRIDGIPIGTRAYVDGPHGAFSIERYPASGYVFIAGGVGITPFMSFLRTMADRRDPRPILLLYAANDWDGITYREDIDELRTRLDLDVRYVLGSAPPDWRGDTGRVDRDLLARLLPKDRLGRQVFLCGPPPMMEAVQAALLDLGIGTADIHNERFKLA